VKHYYSTGPDILQRLRFLLLIQKLAIEKIVILSEAKDLILNQIVIPHEVRDLQFGVLNTPCGADIPVRCL
jgi:hypothetical protein